MNEISLEVLNLSVPVHNCLYRANIKTIKALIEYYKIDKDFSKIKNLTSKGREELIDKFDKFLKLNNINLNEEERISEQFKSEALGIICTLIDENLELFKSVKDKKSMLLTIRAILNGESMGEEKEMLLSIKALIEENNRLKEENNILGKELEDNLKKI